MKTYRYTVGELPNIIIPLGLQGENEARQIQIDFSAWMTDGVVGYPELKVLTPSGILYWASACRGDEAGIEDGENIYCWTLHNVDTGESGNGLIRIILFGENGERLKSQAARTYLAPEFDEAIEPPVSEEIWEAWMDEMGERAAATKDNAYKAHLDAAAAEAYAIAIKENHFDMIDGLMNLATAMAFSIGLDEWTVVDGVYTVTKNNAIITEDSAAIMHLDDTNAAKCSACIEMVTGDGTITFKTETIPTGDLAGTLMLQGRFADTSPEMGHIFQDLTVTATTTPTASATLTHDGGHYNIEFGLQKGEPGDVSTQQLEAAIGGAIDDAKTATLADITSNGVQSNGTIEAHAFKRLGGAVNMGSHLLWSNPSSDSPTAFQPTTITLNTLIAYYQAITMEFLDETTSEYWTVILLPATYGGKTRVYSNLSPGLSYTVYRDITIANGENSTTVITIGQGKKNTGNEIVIDNKVMVPMFLRGYAL